MGLVNPLHAHGSGLRGETQPLREKYNPDGEKESGSGFTAGAAV